MSRNKAKWDMSGINLISNGWLLDKYLFYRKAVSAKIRGYRSWIWDMGIYSMAIEQSERDKFP